METVKNNNERKNNYRREYIRYNKAIKNEFYLEAIAIVYAIIEDRLVSFLHHAGIVSRDTDNLKITRATYPYMRKLMGKDENGAIRIKDISVKMEIIKRLLELDELQSQRIDREVEEYVKRNNKRGIAKIGYMNDLYIQINKTVNKGKVIDLFQRFDPWKDTRNKLIHALLNKTARTTEMAKKECAEKGYRLSREFDDLLSDPFAKNNRIRRNYKIQ